MEILIIVVLFMMLLKPLWVFRVFMYIFVAALLACYFFYKVLTFIIKPFLPKGVT